MGRLEESEKELRLAVEQTDAEDLRTRASLVHTLVLRGRTAEAGTLVEALVAKAPKDPEVAPGARAVADRRRAPGGGGAPHGAGGGRHRRRPLVEMAEAWLAKGDAARAQSAAEAALQRTPGQPWATGVLGHALVLQGRRDAGLAALRRGVAAQPKRPQAWRSLAAGFEAARDVASAPRLPARGVARLSRAASIVQGAGQVRTHGGSPLASQGLPAGAFWWKSGLERSTRVRNELRTSLPWGPEWARTRSTPPGQLVRVTP